MIVLTIRTDKPEAEIGLFDGERQLAYNKFLGHRQLAETIHKKIAILMIDKYKLSDIGGIVCFEGPGSFTGLRIGLTVANTLAFGLGIPIVAVGGKNWQQAGINKLLTGANDKLALPKYGAPVHITEQRK